MTGRIPENRYPENTGGVDQGGCWNTCPAIGLQTLRAVGEYPQECSRLKRLAHVLAGAANLDALDLRAAACSASESGSVLPDCFEDAMALIKKHGVPSSDALTELELAQAAVIANIAN